MYPCEKLCQEIEASMKKGRNCADAAVMEFFVYLQRKNRQLLLKLKNALES